MKEKSWKKIASYSTLVLGLIIVVSLVFYHPAFEELGELFLNWYGRLNEDFPIMLLAGFLAQMVDGTLGMGYGVTSAILLLSIGVNPVAISSSIHTAEIFASGASGYSHYKFRNVNKKLFKALLIPGVLGSIAGAAMLVLLGENFGKIARACIAVYTLILGIAFIINAFRALKKQKKFKRHRLLAGFGGFFDSFGGGGWGPIVTSTLVNKGRNYKYVVGSVSLTEFFVTLSSALTFFLFIGASHWQIIFALVLGGVIAAPIAARLTGKLPRKISFLLLGMIVIFWSCRIMYEILL